MAVFSCEAHNDKGLTVSKGVQINIKGEQEGQGSLAGPGGGEGHRIESDLLQDFLCNTTQVSSSLWLSVLGKNPQDNYKAYLFLRLGCLTQVICS